MATTKQANKTADTKSDKPAEETTKRTKANYPVVMGEVLNHVKSNPGVHRNSIGNHFKSKYRFSVIYEAIKRLLAQGKMFGNGAKKNETFWMTQKEASEHKPEPRSQTPRKSDEPYVLEQKQKNGKWRATTGGTELEPVREAYNLSITTDGEFRVMDNTGDKPKEVISNEEPAKATTAKTDSKVPAKG